MSDVSVNTAPKKKRKYTRKSKAKTKTSDASVLYGAASDSSVQNPESVYLDDFGQLQGISGSTTAESSSENDLPGEYLGFFSPQNDTIVINVSKIIKSMGGNIEEEILKNNDYRKGFITFNLNDDKGELLERRFVVNGQYMLKNQTSFSINPAYCCSTVEKITSDIILILKVVDFNWLTEYDNDIYDFSALITWSDYTINLQLYASLFEKNISVIEKCSQPLFDNDVSYMLIRTNPKLSGNIKLVVDNNYNLYLDTFKVSSVLNSNKYRKLPISTEGNYPRDIRQAFKDLPKGDLYKLPDNVTQAHKIYTDLDDQYETIYNYGVETNSDFLYPENFRMLAPLWINDILPDFFVIFRIDSFYNSETYLNSVVNDTDKFKAFLKDGEIVKVFDMCSHTPIGEYLHNYKDKYYSNNSVFLQFSQYNRTAEENKNLKPLGKNSWHGISLDTGVVVHKDETCYYGNKIIDSNNQELFDGYLVEGFERNNMVSSQLINLEWLFNDPDSEDYSMHRYFGLYLKKNEFLSFACVEKRNDNGYIDIIKYDNDWNVIDDSVYNKIYAEYPNKIFLGECGSSIKRITSEYDKNIFLSQEAANKAGNVVLQTESEYVGTYDTLEFMTLKMKRPMSYGEHIKIVIPNDTLWKSQYVFEIIASNDSKLKNCEDYISPYILYNHKDVFIKDASVYIRTNEENISGNNGHAYKGDLYNDEINNYPYTHVAQFDSDWSERGELEVDSINELPETVYTGEEENVVEFENSFRWDFSKIEDYPRVFRLCFYSQDIFNADQTADMEDQLKRIAACIKKFNYAFYTGYATEDSISIISNKPNTYIQHITSDILNIPYNKDLYSKLNLDFMSEEDRQNEINRISDIYKNNGITDETFEFLNEIVTDVKVYPTSFDTVNYTQKTVGFAPIDFELLGWRKSSIVKFIQMPKMSYEISLHNDSLDYFNTILCGKSIGSGFVKLSKFKVSENAVVMVLDDHETVNSTLMNENITETLYLRSPYHADKWIISSPEPLNSVNGKLNIYEPLKCDISLMGLIPVKDFDYGKEMSSQTIQRNEKLELNNGDKVYIDDFYSENNIYTTKLYSLEKGQFRNIDIPEQSNFIIFKRNDEYVIFYKGKSSVIKSGYIEILSETAVIKSQKTSFGSDISIQQRNHDILNYYKNSDINDDFVYPVTMPVVFKWESEGIYGDLNSELNTQYISTYKDNTIVPIIGNIGIFNNHINICSSLTDNIYIKGSERVLTTWKSAILNNEIDYPITNFLKLNKNSHIKFSKTEFEDYIDSLYFIFNGLKINIKLQNYLINKNINFANYNNYNILLYYDYINDSANSEFIISEPEKIILFVIHNVKFNDFTSLSGSDKTYKPVNENLFSSDLTSSLLGKNKWYNWKQTSNYVNIDMTYGNIDMYKNNRLVTKWNEGKSLSDSITASDDTIYAYMSWHNYDNYILNENNINGIAWTGPYKNMTDVDNSYILLKNSYIWNYTSTIFTNINPLTDPAWGPLTVEENNDNYKEGYVIDYSLNTLLNENITLDYLAEKILANNMDLYIIKSDKSLLNFNDCILNEHITVNIEKPVSDSGLKYNYGYFRPKFVDIFEFDNNESEKFIMDIGKSYLYGNTSFNRVNSLKDSYYNKVYNKNIKDSILVNYDKKTVRLFDSNWDKNYYTLWDNNDYTYVNGYINGIEDKSFFGSKGLVLNNPEIVIEDWYNIINSSVTDSKYSDNAGMKETGSEWTYKPVKSKDSWNIDINLTHVVYNYFKQTDKRLYENWTAFSTVNKEVSFNNYIKNTLLKYFKIHDKHNLKLFSKIQKRNGTDSFILSKKPNDFNLWTEERNFSTTYENVNNNIILHVSFKYVPNKDYFFTLNIKSV